MKTPIEKLLEIITLKEKENAIYLMPIIDKIDIDKLISEEKQLLIHSVVVPKGTLVCKNDKKSICNNPMIHECCNKHRKRI